MGLEPLKSINICEAPCIGQTFRWTSWCPTSFKEVEKVGMHNRMKRCKTGIKKLMEFRYLPKKKQLRTFSPLCNLFSMITRWEVFGGFRGNVSTEKVAWVGCISRYPTSKPAGSVENRALQNQALDVWKMVVSHFHGFFFGEE